MILKKEYKTNSYMGNDFRISVLKKYAPTYWQ